MAELKAGMTLVEVMAARTPCPDCGHMELRLDARSAGRHLICGICSARYPIGMEDSDAGDDGVESPAPEPRKPRTFDYVIGGCTLPLPCGGYVTHHAGLVPHTEVHRCSGSKCGDG